MHKFETHFVDSNELFTRLKTYESKLDLSLPLTFDLETNNKEELKADIYGIGLCFTDSTAFYIPIKNPKGNLLFSPPKIKEIYQWIFTIAKKRGLCGWNVLYDILVFDYNTGYVMDDFVVLEGMLMKHLLDEEPPFALKENAVRYLGNWADKAQQVLKDEVLAKGGRWTKDEKDMYLASTKTLGEYCCWDVILTNLLCKEFYPTLEEENLLELYETEVLPLYKLCTINMKRKGFPIDLEHFKKLNVEIAKDLKNLEDDLHLEVEEEVEPFCMELLQKEFPIKKTGNFPKALAEVLGAPLPVTKDGKVTMSQKAIEKQRDATPEFRDFYDWVLDKTAQYIQTGMYPSDVTDREGFLYKVRLKMFEAKRGHQRAFNFNSSDHLAELFIKIRGMQPLGTTDTGKPKVDKEFVAHLDSMGDSIASKLNVYKKLSKIQSTYIEGILSRQVNGVIHTSMLQHGTTSGRFSSRNPNLQNLSRPIEEQDKDKFHPLIFKYTNAVREGFVAPKDYKLVDADYSSLEPRVFAHMSGDPKLIAVFNRGEDLYSRIAIDVFNLEGVSANPDDSNYLKKVEPSFRQRVKVFALAVPYGSESSRISHEMNTSYGEAKKIIDSYLRSYPKLKQYMANCNYQAKTLGYVKTELGRVRHLKEVRAMHVLYGNKFDITKYKEASKRNLLEQRRKFKNGLNNAKNFRIQGLAAHIVNRAMIEIEKEFRQKGIDGYVASQIHDQIVCLVREDQAQQAKDIVRDKMENTTKISVPLLAEPQIANNLKDSH